ncbi:MAG TPA: winged helix-turn-helix domain-containing protein [Amaricoccus sp.]|nr:winged helix-turn-helix domain-containing protein [Amaricoccus sp.]
MVAAHPDRIVSLGAARVDLDAERVTGPDGRAVALRPQTFAVLKLLIANPGRLVTKDELQTAVWPGIAVTDDSLVQCIGEIRKALGDEARSLVETVPRRGYRLTTGQRPARQAAWYDGRAAIIGATLVLVALGVGAWRTRGAEEAASHAPVVAVLPFHSMAGAAEAYLGAGVAEDVISMLARTPDVAVIARSSSFAYGDAPRDIREIGAALGADYVLEGSVRREGDKLRIVAQLEDAETGQHVWADRFDRVATDPWALVDEVSGRIIFALAGEKGEIKRVQFREAWGKDETSLGEYDYFLRGLDIYMNGEGPPDIARAEAIWAEGLAKYPDSALIKTKMAWGHWTAAWRYWDDMEKNFAEADRMVSEVLGREGLSPEVQRAAHWLNAFVLMQRGDYADGVAEAERTIALTPYDARVLRQLTDVLIADGRYEMALEWLARGEPREPGREEDYTLQRALIHRLMGQDEEALAEYARVPEPEIYPRLSRAIALDHLGRTDEAREAVQDALTVDPDFTQALWREGAFYSDPAILQGELAALGRAGLPE